VEFFTGFFALHKLAERTLSRGIPVKIGVSSDEEIQAEAISARNMQDKD
jgi:hypothetical protein